MQYHIVHIDSLSPFVPSLLYSFENKSSTSRHAYSLHVVDTDGCKWVEDNWWALTNFIIHILIFRFHSFCLEKDLNNHINLHYWRKGILMASGSPSTDVLNAIFSCTRLEQNEFICEISEGVVPTLFFLFSSRIRRKVDPEPLYASWGLLPDYVYITKQLH